MKIRRQGILRFNRVKEKELGPVPFRLTIPPHGPVPGRHRMCPYTADSAGSTRASRAGIPRRLISGTGPSSLPNHGNPSPVNSLPGKAPMTF